MLNYVHSPYTANGILKIKKGYMNIIKLIPENRRSYCEDCGDCLQIVGQGNYDWCIACEDRKQKEGKDYIDKRTIYQKYLELFVWKGNKNGNTI